MLSRDEILNKNELKRETVHVPEWGGDVIVAEMDGTARDAWEQSIVPQEDKSHLNNVRAKLVVASVVDENGNRLFRPGDVSAVGKLSARSLDKVCSAAQRVSGLTDREIDEAEKNSDAVPSGSSTSD